MESRSPFQNDLIVDPGQSAVLHESNTLSKPARFSSDDPGLSFEWMLSVPAPFTEVTTTMDGVTTPTVISQFSIPHFKNYKIPNVVMSWNMIPFAWHSMCRRKTQVKFVCVKAFSPGKLAIEQVYGHPDIGFTLPPVSISADLVNKRNLYSEHDISSTQIISKEFDGCYHKGSKWSTVPVVDTSVLKDETAFAPRKVDSFTEMDGVISIIQPVSFQRGMLFPNKFNIYCFISYAGTTLQTIGHPGTIQTQAVAPNDNSSVYNVPLIPQIIGSSIHTYLNADIPK